VSASPGRAKAGSPRPGGKARNAGGAASTKPLAVVAVGGNALILDDQHMALADQYHAVCETAAHVATMIGAGWNVVLTHGNGPQVGFILRRSEIADGQVPTVPVQYAVGDTQGAIGFMFQNALGNALARLGLRVPVVTLVTQTLVDRRDPAFAKPDKPIGSFMTEEVARRLATELGWAVMQDGNRGWRRVIASPQPVRVIEAPIIERLAREGVLIIACGGGGIAVEEGADGELHGVEAVIDKDRASALLAIEMRAELLMIPTGVARVAIRFGQPGEEWLDRITVEQAEAYAAEGHFGAGSMGPKIEALLSFVKRRPGGRGVITNVENIEQALRGETGTWIER
jgi:carbamate kinase